MPCYHPLPCYLARTRNAKTGKRSVVFSVNDGYKDKALAVPCGQCIGCRLGELASGRCAVSTSKLYEHNLFVTLSYEDDKLPPGGSLRPRDFVLFMKKLRKRRDGVRFSMWRVWR